MVGPTRLSNQLRSGPELNADRMYLARRVLSVVGEHADVRTMNVLVSSRLPTLLSELSCIPLNAGWGMLKNRGDYSEKLYLTFEKLISTFDARQISSKRSLDSLVVDGLSPSSCLLCKIEITEA